jgi:hypothetical protein
MSELDASDIILPIDPPPQAARALSGSTVEAQVLLLPGVASDEEGYAVEGIDLAKWLRQGGVTAEPAEPREGRKYIDLKAADLFLGTVGFTLQLLASGGGQLLADAIEHLLGGLGQRRVRLRVAVYEDNKSKARWFQADGRGEDVVKALRTWKS